jgi:hypothetical protein
MAKTIPFRATARDDCYWSALGKDYKDIASFWVSRRTLEATSSGAIKLGCATVSRPLRSPSNFDLSLRMACQYPHMCVPICGISSNAHRASPAANQLLEIAMFILVQTNTTVPISHRPVICLVRSCDQLG